MCTIMVSARKIDKENLHCKTSHELRGAKMGVKHRDRRYASIIVAQDCMKHLVHHKMRFFDFIGSRAGLHENSQNLLSPSRALNPINRFSGPEVISLKDDVSGCFDFIAHTYVLLA